MGNCCFYKNLEYKEYEDQKYEDQKYEDQKINIERVQSIDINIIIDELITTYNKNHPKPIQLEIDSQREIESQLEPANAFKKDEFEKKEIEKKEIEKDEIKKEINFPLKRMNCVRII